MSARAIVFGAGGAVGEAAAQALLQAGWQVGASLRQRRGDTEARLQAAGATLLFHDIEADAAWARDADGADALVFTTHLDIAARALLGAAISARRIVVFSSNNIAADRHAPSYRALAETERALRLRFPHIAIVRPTLIYGDPRLATLTRLMRMAKTQVILPMPGPGSARVQPIFHADLGALAAGLARQDAPSGIFAAGGPDIVSMSELYAEVLRALGRRALIIPVPRMVLKLAAPYLAARGVFSVEQAERAGKDRVAIAQDAAPAELLARTPLKTGLAHLARLLTRT